MSNLAAILEWKFPGVQGIECREEAGALRCTAHPDGVPNQAQIDTWTAEYLAAEPWKDQQTEAELGTDVVRVIIETIVPMIQNGTITTMTSADVIAQAKANRRAEL